MIRVSRDLKLIRTIPNRASAMQMSLIVKGSQEIVLQLFPLEVYLYHITIY